METFLYKFDPGNGEVFTFQIAKLEETDEISDFMFQNFFLTSPNRQLCRCDDPAAAAQIKPFVSEYLRECIVQNISLTVRDSLGHLAGVRINKLENKGDYDDKKDNPEFNETLIRAILFSLNEGVDIYSKYSTERVIIFVMMSVGSKYGRLGLAKKMVEISLEFGKTAGAGAAKAEAVSTYAAKALAKAGFETLKTIDYATFEFKDDTPLARETAMLDEHSKGLLMARSLL